MHGNVEAIREDGVTLLRCEVCRATCPLDAQAWVDSINDFSARHYHGEATVA